MPFVLPNMYQAHTAILKAIEEILTEGYGTAPYIVPLNSFSMEWLYDGQLEQAQSQASLTKPQIRAEITGFRDRNGWPKPNTKTMWDVDITIQVVFKLDTQLIQRKRREVEGAISNACVVVATVLQQPGIMNTTSTGAVTGLASGRLIFKGYRKTKFDYKLNAGLATMNFTGVLVTNNAAV